MSAGQELSTARGITNLAWEVDFDGLDANILGTGSHSEALEVQLDLRRGKSVPELRISQSRGRGCLKCFHRRLRFPNKQERQGQQPHHFASPKAFLAKRDGLTRNSSPQPRGFSTTQEDSWEGEGGDS